MKKLIAMLFLIAGIGFAAKAQTTEVKVKKTTTPGQKVHNTFSKKKKYKGVKIKAKQGDKKVKGEINTTGEGEIKQKQK